MEDYSINDVYDEILYDVKKDGSKEISWKAHKLAALRLAYSYKRLGNEKKFKRIVECGKLLEFYRYSDNSKRLNKAYFCQTRLCPTCIWRRSRKVFAQLSNIMNAITAETELDFIFLTLTCKNVSPDMLKERLDDMYSAFKRLYVRERFMAAVRGWFRCLEITYNWQTDEFHPHFHVVLAVDKEYFTSDLYIEQAEWCEIWKSCMDLDYTPIVDIRRFENSEKGIGKEVAEVSKYTVKMANILVDMRGISQYSEDIQAEAKKVIDCRIDKVVATLDNVMAYRRIIGFGGIFKQKHKELNLDNVEDGDLVVAGSDELRKDLDYVLERYCWNIGYKNYMKISEHLPNQQD